MSNVPHPKGGKAAKSASTAQAPASPSFSDSGRPVSHHIRERALSLSEVLLLRLPPDIELLGRLIVAYTIGLLYGLFGGAKSIFAMIIAHSIAGRKFVTPWGQGCGDTVFYLEDKMRISGLRERFGCKNANLYELIILGFLPAPVKLPTPSGAPGRHSFWPESVVNACVTAVAKQEFDELRRIATSGCNSTFGGAQQHASNEVQ